MIVLCILVFIYLIFNIKSIVNVFMLSIEKKIVLISTSTTLLINSLWFVGISFQGSLGNCLFLPEEVSVLLTV